MSNMDKITELCQNNDNEDVNNIQKQVGLTSDADKEIDAFPTSISNKDCTNTVNKTTNALNRRSVFRKRSSTESAVMFESPKLQPRTRRFSRPLIESVLKNNDKQNRLSKIIEKRHSRLSQHILKYIQLYIKINGCQDFSITVEKKKTVEDLIHQIEAEYAFQFLFPKNKNIGELKKEFSEPYLLTNQQFECNAIMNSDGDILKYTDVVGDVFDMFDTVVCTNVYEEKIPVRDTYRILNDISDKEIDSEKGTEENSSYKNTQMDVIQEQQINDNDKNVMKNKINNEKVYSMLNNLSLDERFQSILHNKITLNVFYTFCLKEYSVENILFWLDIEILQTVNKEQLELYSKYIYYTYIDDRAPLQISITEEIRSEIDIDKIDYSDSKAREVYDDAQEHIYILLKTCLYQKFENNKIYNKLVEYKKNNRSEYEKNRILGYFGNYYKPDYDVIEEKLEFIRTKNSESKDIENNSSNTENESYHLLYQNNWLNSAISQGVVLNNDEELKKYMKTGERRIKEVKNMKLQKGKKLAKFFGEIVDVETLCQQVKKISKQEEETKNDSTFDLTLTKKEEKKSVRNIKNEFDQEERKRLIRKNEKLNSVLGETLTEDQIKNIIDVDKRRKRMKYLQHFLYSQVDDKEIINEIKIEQEKAMVERRSNKLKKYFGQAPPPDLINNISFQMENRHRRSIISLTLLMSKENGIINLFNMISDIEKREDLFDDKSNISVPAEVTIFEEENEEGNDNKNNIVTEGTGNDNNNCSGIDNGYESYSDSEEFSECNVELPERKGSDITENSIKDQNEYIYEIYENKNIEYLVERNVFLTLEESINEDITDPETKEGFKRQLSYLRESFRKNSSNIRRMSQMNNTLLIKDKSEKIWKGSNLLKPMIDNETIVNRDYTDISDESS
ncbi:hypothetical protein BCR36DRAFT_408376 [Piromyces finnis]|uniref:RGS domain-containing protein n=1 Tax=Piromyces finnis TaxID=1754191 RepID=A0A1Y1VNQ4_9FUNG|nr:hypothetical protein BCR36DRAFT_408376 [Piromyces finnis]|eukprot:ORX60010.1 hypothetical protein BCR36DRAFT_408376 [Piromyces finnis]